MNRKFLSLSLIATVAAIFLAACGSSKHAAPQVMLAMNTPPPGSLEIGLTVPLSATTTNDSSGGGIAWTLSCDTGANCGTLSTASSNSGDTIAFTAPATIPEGDVPSGGMAVNVTATSTTTSSVFATATVVIFPVSDTQLIAGNYSFYVEGTDVNGFLYTAAGSVVLDGAGNVMGGEEDFFSTFNATPSVGDVITSGTYLVNQTGTGNLVVNVATPGSPPVTDPTVGVGGTQTFSVVAVNNNHLRIEEFDAAATSLGSMDFQTIGDLTSVAGGYAYILSGVDDVGAPLGIGGVFSTDGSGGFSNDQSDVNDGGVVNLNATGQGGTFTAPDVNGRGTATIGALGFAYYQIGPEALVFVETDGTQATVGEALGQGSSAGAFSAASVGPAAFGAIGSTFAIASVAGQFTADGTSAFTGFSDANENAAVISSGSTSGTYTLQTSGYGNFAITGGDFLTATGDITTFGMYAIDPALNINDPNNANNAAGGAFVLNLDNDAVMTGVLATQSDATDVFNSNNAISFGGEDTTGQIDLVGQFLSDGVSSITGTGDLNQLFGVNGQQPAVALSGTFTADPTNPGRSTVALTIAGGANPNNVVLYQASPGLSFYIDVDVSPGPVLEVASGYIEGQ
jgi:hypothetical protein